MSKYYAFGGSPEPAQAPEPEPPKKSVQPDFIEEENVDKSHLRARRRKATQSTTNSSTTLSNSSPKTLLGD